MRCLKTAVVITLLSAMALWAEMPVGNLGIASLGISYTFEINGYTVEDQSSAVTSILHMGGLHYAPIPYTLFTLKFGAGGVKAQDMGVVTKGDPGFAFTGGLNLFTPEFAKILTVTGGAAFTTLSSDAGTEYVTSRNVRSHLGLIIEALAFMDLELGAKYNYYFGHSDVSYLAGDDFANEDRVMGYAQVTLHNPAIGAFISINGEFSPETQTDGEGIYNSVLSVSIGTVLSHQRRAKFSRD